MCSFFFFFIFFATFFSFVFFFVVVTMFCGYLVTISAPVYFLFQHIVKLFRVQPQARYASCTCKLMSPALDVRVFVLCYLQDGRVVNLIFARLGGYR